MERIMSVEDKIRRAEEIYNRRRANEYRSTTTRVSVENNKNIENRLVNKRLKKMIIQIVLCMIIYLTFYYIINNNYVFSEDFKTKCTKILSYDISFSEMYKKVSSQIILIKEKYQQEVDKIEKNKKETNALQEEQKNNEEIEESQQQIENQSSENVENNGTEVNEEVETKENSNENIGGTVEEIEKTELNNGEKNELTEGEQMKKEAQEIKSKISFVKPVEGVITSDFGWRNPTVSTVSKYHTGIDIGAKEGTDIVSATNGKVILASSEGAYGNHLKIQIGDITIIYAHCLRLEVKEGDEITQGQIIAKVGTTGNSTGPHLHFEIRKQERYIDPELIVDF